MNMTRIQRLGYYASTIGSLFLITSTWLIFFLKSFEIGDDMSHGIAQLQTKRSQPSSGELNISISLLRETSDVETHGHLPTENSEHIVARPHQALHSRQIDQSGVRNLVILTDNASTNTEPSSQMLEPSVTWSHEQQNTGVMSESTVLGQSVAIQREASSAISRLQDNHKIKKGYSAIVPRKIRVTQQSRSREPELTDVRCAAGEVILYLPHGETRSPIEGQQQPSRGSEIQRSKAAYDEEITATRIGFSAFMHAYEHGDPEVSAQLGFSESLKQSSAWPHALEHVHKVSGTITDGKECKSDVLVFLGCMTSLEVTEPVLSTAMIYPSITSVALHSGCSSGITGMFDRARDELGIQNIITVDTSAGASRQSLALGALTGIKSSDSNEDMKGFWIQEPRFSPGAIKQFKAPASTSMHRGSVPYATPNLHVESWHSLHDRFAIWDDPLSWPSMDFNIRCRSLSILPGTLHELVDIYLPSEVEIVMSIALAWCDVTILLEPGNWKFEALWATFGDFLRNVKTRMQNHISATIDDYDARLGDSGMEHQLNVSLLPQTKFRMMNEHFIAIVGRIRTKTDPLRPSMAGSRHHPISANCSLTFIKSRTCDLGLNLIDLRDSAPPSRAEVSRLVAAALTYHSHLGCAIVSQAALQHAGGRLVGCQKATRMRHFDQSTRNQAQVTSRVSSLDGPRGHEIARSSIHIWSQANEFKSLALENQALEWWRVLKPSFMGRFTALLVGDTVGMLAIKLARWAPLSTIVCRRFSAHASIERMARILGASNIITASDDNLYPVEHQNSSYKFTYTMLGAPTLIRYLHDCHLEDWELKVGRVVSTAQYVAWIEMPRLATIGAVIGTLHPECQAALVTRYGQSEVVMTKLALSAVAERRIAMIDVLTSPRAGLKACSSSLLSAQPSHLVPKCIAADEQILIQLTFHGTNKTTTQMSKTHEFEESGSIPLGTLLSIGLRALWKRRLLRSYLDDLRVWQLAAVDAGAIGRGSLRFGPVESPGLIQDRASLPRSRRRSSESWLSPTLRLVSPLIAHAQLHAPLWNETLWLALKQFLRESPAEGRNGDFSFIEWGGVTLPLASLVAREFPNATVVAVLGANAEDVDEGNGPENLIQCSNVAIDRTLTARMYDSPELARYSFLSLEHLYAQGQSTAGAHSSFSYNNRDTASKDMTSKIPMTAVIDLALGHGNTEASYVIGDLVLSTLTSFIPMPSAAHVSLAMDTIFGLSSIETNQHESPHVSLTDTTGSPQQHAHTHPSADYSDFEARLFQRISKKPSMQTHDRTVAQTRILVSGSDSASGGVISATTGLFGPRLAPLPLARVDVVSHVRHVHHHFDWARDGHKRTYTMHIVTNVSILPRNVEQFKLLRGSTLSKPAVPTTEDGGGIIKLRTLHAERFVELPVGYHVSNGRILHVYLTRDEDGSYIPYGTIRSITLIAAMRLGLIPAHRRRAFSAFVRLPLYEDMAPWNVAFAGDKLEYIDYDTRNETYDSDVPKVYRVLSVLMNYKRTVQDFDMCGSRARTAYGFSHVAECVRPINDVGQCETNSKFPVPCDDGRCHTDFVSCLRSLSQIRREAVGSRSALASLRHPQSNGRVA